jgi:HK97 family phage portal protein
MRLGEKIKEIFTPSNWTDKAFIANASESFSSNDYRGNSYVGINGIHNYAQTERDNGFSIIDPYRSLTYGGYAQSNFVELFHCVPEIFAPIHAIASRIANADFQLRKVKNDQVVYDNEDWNRLFNTPNPLQHFRELIYEAVVYEYVTGNGMMYFFTPSTLLRNYQNISTIWNLPSNKIDIVTKKPLKLYTATTLEDIISEYKLDDNNKFKPEDVLHIRGANLKWEDGKFKGKSPLLSADKAIQNLIAVYEARNVIYTKRGALGFIVSRKSDDSGLVSLTKGEKQGVINEYNGNYGITNNKSPIGITEAPIDFVKIGMSISELQPFEETEADAAAIYGALNVPFELAPKPKGSTFNNLSEAKKGFYQSVIIPKANMYMQSLTNKLGLNEAKLYLHADFSQVDELQENKKEKAEVDRTNTEVYRQRFLHGVCTLNDWVISTGNEKITTDEIYSKRVFEMSDEEMVRIKNMLALSGMNKPTTEAKPEADPQ